MRITIGCMHGAWEDGVVSTIKIALFFDMIDLVAV